MIEQNIELPVDLPMKFIFDILTPRPHFVIVHHEKHRKINATENEIQQIMKLVNEFLRRKPQYDNNAVLSFHRGKWYQQIHKHFHAHFCFHFQLQFDMIQIDIDYDRNDSYRYDQDDTLQDIYKRVDESLRINKQAQMTTQRSAAQDEDLLLQDFSRNVTTKSWILFSGNAAVVSAIPL
ncbi:unnamed protein product, partial [Rotaria magnacalcarata]